MKEIAKDMYVDNAKLYKTYVQWYEDIKKAKEEGREEPVMPNFIGECIIKICTRLSYRENFIGYSYKESMISDAVFDCLRYAKKFNPEYKNVFGYFSRTAWRAFLRRIDEEKTEVYTRALLINKTPIEDFISHLEHDDDSELSSFVEFLDDYNVLENNLPMSIKRKMKKEEEERNREKIELPPTILEKCFVNEE